MLVLSRKLNERIVIDNDIIVTVVKIDRNQVRIGIEAPGHIPVYREEILPATRASSHRFRDHGQRGGAPVRGFLLDSRGCTAYPGRVCGGRAALEKGLGEPGYGR